VGGREKVNREKGSKHFWGEMKKEEPPNAYPRAYNASPPFKTKRGKWSLSGGGAKRQVSNPVRSVEREGLGPFEAVREKAKDGGGKG